MIWLCDCWGPRQGMRCQHSGCLTIWSYKATTPSLSHLMRLVKTSAWAEEIDRLRQWLPKRASPGVNLISMSL